MEIGNPRERCSRPAKKQGVRELGGGLFLFYGGVTELESMLTNEGVNK